MNWLNQLFDSLNKLSPSAGGLIALVLVVAMFLSTLAMVVVFRLG